MNIPFVVPRRTIFAFGLLLASSVVLGLESPPAFAGIDLLRQPARQSPLAARGVMLALAKAGSRLVAAGERGIILYSDDAGKSWIQGTVPVSVTLTALYFVSSDIGWAAGHDGVLLQTTDGGMTWHKQLDGYEANKLVLDDLAGRVEEAKARGKGGALTVGSLDEWQAALDDANAGAAFGPARPLLGLWFKNASEGIAVGAFGQLFRTANGGKSWESWGARIVNPDGFHYNAISQLPDQSVVITGEAGKIYRSRDHGKSWSTIDTGYSGHLYGTVGFPESPVLLSFGFAGNILRSVDDGKTWNALPRQTRKSLVGGLVLPDGVLVLAGQDRSLLVSRDRGATFTKINPVPGQPIAAVLAHPLAGGELVVVGAGGVSLLAADQKAR